MKRHLKINTIQEDLQKQLQALSPNKFLGRDGIHPKQAERTASVISESVQNAFNESPKKENYH